MFERVEFENFRALQKAQLPLGRFTLIVGPNGSGKSTALLGLQSFQQPKATGLFGNLGYVALGYEDVVSAGVSALHACVHLKLATPIDAARVVQARWGPKGAFQISALQDDGRTVNAPVVQGMLNRIRIYAFDAETLAVPVQVQPGVELGPRGENLAAVINLLQDAEPERFEALNAELHRWIPEFDRVTWNWGADQTKELALRTTSGAKIRAAHLSSGTLFALAVLALAHSPDPPPLIGLEEPDHGLHPRLLRDLKDAINRLCYPESCGEQREPVQVVATTHSPYFLDLFKDRPEEIVMANKVGSAATFQRLVDIPRYEEYIEDAALGDIWYSGILGGVPSGP